MMHASTAIIHDDTEYNNCMDALDQFLCQFSRPLTILEINAKDGTYSFRIAEKYNAVCVMTEQTDKALILANRCKKKQLQTVMVLNKRFSLDELKRLGECEHFDIVLILHDFITLDNDYKHTIESMSNLGDYTFMRINSTDPTFQDMHAYLQEKSSQQFTIKNSHHPLKNSTLFLIEKEKKYLARRYWNFKRLASRTSYTIETNFQEKYFHKKQGNQTLPWHAGINLLTFKTLNGIYPTKEMIYEKVSALRHIQHTDFNIWNIIIQGNNLIPIDTHDKFTHYSPAINMEKVLAHFRSRKINTEA